ncbi:MAG: hypothetical protein QOK29_3556 [Rhodospirillaceae bacterium]|nr:hypothetical protein [Rhodospirillaceae bacterium]
MSEVARHGTAERAKARASVVLLGLLWGLNWPAVRIALGDLTPWSLRASCLGVGALAVFALARLRRRPLTVPPGRPRLHLAVLGLLNVAFFNLLIAFSQLATATSRAAIVTYTMPIWTTLLARLVLGERLTRRRILALALGAAGIAILSLPLATAGFPVGILYALGAGLSWAAGTVYLKWARIVADPIAIAAWQLAFGALAVACGMAIFEGVPHLWPLHPAVIAAVIYHALLGIGLAYFLWFEIIARLPASTAALGTLLVPVVGVLSAMLLLGERPTVPDIVGFVLVFAAAASVILQPNGQS